MLPFWFFFLFFFFLHVWTDSYKQGFNKFSVYYILFANASGASMMRVLSRFRVHFGVLFYLKRKKKRRKRYARDFGLCATKVVFTFKKTRWCVDLVSHSLSLSLDRGIGRSNSEMMMSWEQQRIWRREDGVETSFTSSLRIVYRPFLFRETFGFDAIDSRLSSKIVRFFFLFARDGE